MKHAVYQFRSFLFSLILLTFTISALVSTVVSNKVSSVSQHEVEQIAGANARQLWGSNLDPAAPIPYYGPDDEIIAWHFNYAIGHSFPGEQVLQGKSAEAFSQGDRDLGWGTEEYGNMVIGANRNMPVIIEYSQCLSKEYALGSKIKELAAKAFPAKYEFEKIYYFGLADVWFCVTDGAQKRYINPEPGFKTLSEVEFREYIKAMTMFWTRDNFEEDWVRMLDNEQTIQIQRSMMIPNIDKMPFYEWHNGCSPTTGAMILSWWHNSYDNIGNLVRYHMSDHNWHEDTTDHHVSDACNSLHIHMGTTEQGGTSVGDIPEGYEHTVQNRGYNCSAVQWGVGSTEMFFQIIKNEIIQNMPIHVSIPNHGVAGVGYSENPDIVWVHDPNSPAIAYITRSMVESVTCVHITPNPNQISVKLSYPVGGTVWGNNSGGETLHSGDVYEITWNGDYSSNTYAKLYYHAEGGASPDHWFPISEHTANDGSFYWLVPDLVDCFFGVNSDYGRIRIEIYNSSNEVVASDGSYGNFKIYAGAGIQELWTVQAVDRSPDFFIANLYEESTWNVISIKNEPQGGDDPWDIELYDSTDFTELLKTSEGSEALNYLVVNNFGLAPHEYGVKFLNDSGQTAASAHQSGNPVDILEIGSQTLIWNPAHNAKIWNVCLTPGTWFFDMPISNSAADLDFSLYQMGPQNIFTYHDAVAFSRTPGGGNDESFFYSPTVAGWYGLCVSSRTQVQTVFHINITEPIFGRWTGAVSTSWNIAENWQGHILPTINDDVLIPGGCIRYPTLSSYSASIQSLSIEAGATLNIGVGSLAVYGDLSSYGNINLDNSSSVMEIRGNIIWLPGSHLTTTTNSVITCFGNWTNCNGAFIQATGSTVKMESDRNAFFANYSNNAFFHNLHINKQSNKTVTYLNYSTYNLSIQGQLTLQAGYLGSSCSRQIHVMGSFVTSGGGVRLDHGSLALSGNIQTLTCNPNTWFSDLIINSTAQIQLLSDLHVHGDFWIGGSGMAAGNHNIYVGGSWINYTAVTAFNAGSGTVNFNGGQAVSCNGANFNILEISNNTELHFDATNASSCNSYVWTSGSLTVDGGTLTINDLPTDALRGIFYVEGGALYINQDSGQSIDLRGELHILGGLMRVSGGSGVSTWPSGGNSLVHMSEGVLDFPNCGIILEGNTGYSLTTDITGGIISLAGDLICSRTDFLPTGGTFKIKRGNAIFQNISCNPASRFGNLVIDTALPRKGVTEDGHSSEQRMEQIRLQSDINVYGDLIVLSGTLKLSGHTLSVGNDIDIYGKVIMDNSADLLMANGSFYWYDTAIGLFSAGEIRVSGSFYTSAGAVFQMGTATTFSFTGDFVNSFISNLGSNTSFGNLILDKTDYFVETENNCLPMAVSGNLIINDFNHMSLNSCALTVQGYINAGSDTEMLLVHSSNLSVNGDYKNYGKIIVETGSVLNIGSNLNPVGNVSVGSETVEIMGTPTFTRTSALTITTGTFRWSGSTAPYVTSLNGSINLGTGNLIAVNSKILLGLSSFLYSLADTNYNIYCAGFEASSTSILFAPTTGKITITGHPTGQPSPIIMASGRKFYNLDINSVSGARLESTPIICSGSVNCRSGRLDLNHKNLRSSMGVSLYSGAYLEVDEGAYLQLAAAKTLTVEAGGHLECHGIAGSPAQIGSISGFITYLIKSRGSISARYCIFEKMSALGVQVLSGSLVDPSASFTNCTFRDGTPGLLSARSCYLTLDNSQTISIVGAEFPISLGSYGYNVRKTVGQGEVFMIDATGIFAGEDLDFDPYERIHWGGLPPVNDLTIVLLPNNDLRLSWTYPSIPLLFKIYSSTTPDFTVSPGYLHATVPGNQLYFNEAATSEKKFFKVTATD